MANPYTPEAAARRYPGQASLNQPRPSGVSQTNRGGDQAAQPGPQRAPDMSRYAAPGQAQPIQPQSQGTPYGAQPDLTGGNYAYATPQNRPAPFTQRYTNFDGSQAEQPNFGRRDAFIQNINNAMLPYYTGQAQGAPQFDFQHMWGQAGDMVSNGWQNPFAMPQQPSLEQQLGQYAPPTQYQPVSQQSSPYDPFRNIDPHEVLQQLPPETASPYSPATDYARLREYADQIPGLPPGAMTTMYYDPTTGMATHTPSQPSKMDYFRAQYPQFNTVPQPPSAFQGSADQWAGMADRQVYPMAQSGSRGDSPPAMGQINWEWVRNNPGVPIPPPPPGMLY